MITPRSNAPLNNQLSPLTLLKQLGNESDKPPQASGNKEESGDFYNKIAHTAHEHGDIEVGKRHGTYVRDKETGAVIIKWDSDGTSQQTEIITAGTDGSVNVQSDATREDSLESSVQRVYDHDGNITYRHTIDNSARGSETKEEFSRGKRTHSWHHEFGGLHDKQEFTDETIFDENGKPFKTTHIFLVTRHDGSTTEETTTEDANGHRTSGVTIDRTADGKISDSQHWGVRTDGSEGWISDMPDSKALASNKKSSGPARSHSMHNITIFSA